VIPYRHCCQDQCYVKTEQLECLNILIENVVAFFIIFFLLISLFLIIIFDWFDEILFKGPFYPLCRIKRVADFTLDTPFSLYPFFEAFYVDQFYRACALAGGSNSLSQVDLGP
jgi:hypothetical protein